MSINPVRIFASVVVHLGAVAEGETLDVGVQLRTLHVLQACGLEEKDRWSSWPKPDDFKGPAASYTNDRLTN